MNNFQKTETLNSGSDPEGTACDISTDLLMVKLLGLHSKEDRSPEMKEQDEKKLSPEFTLPPTEAVRKLNLDFNMWHSVGPMKTSNNQMIKLDDDSVHRTHSEQCLAERVKMVCELVSILKTEDKETISKTFLALSSSPESCTVIRQNGVLPLLLQLIHEDGSSPAVRQHASKALHCIVQHNADDKQGRREARVLKMIEQILEYCENEEIIEPSAPSEISNPAPAVAALMKLSFDEEHRIAMVQLGALHALAKLIQTDHRRHNCNVENLSVENITVRRYACMALTNLTFGDSTNKTLLCSLESFMRALVAQLRSPNEDLCQVTASVLRNLSWRAGDFIKKILREIDAVSMLMKIALHMRKESTLKAVLSALWNLSAHSHLNKVDICNVDGAIEYLVTMLNYQAPSGTLVITENVGGVLRNVSGLIAVQDDYRAILRKHNCFYVLLQQLKSPSLTIVSNACGTLWNLTARNVEDQCMLIQLGAINMLRSLTHSKHKTISVASAAAMRNLASCRVHPAILNDSQVGTLAVRKQRAMELELNDFRLHEAAELRTESNVSASCGSTSPPEQATARGASNDVGDPSKTRSSNSVRFSLSFGEDGKREQMKSPSPSVPNCRSPTDGKDVLIKSDERIAKPDYSCNGSCDEDDMRTGKSNGYRKMEEPYNVDDTFGDYAETDLDQPTNYSLRFSEHGSDVRRTSNVEPAEMSVSGSVESASDGNKLAVAENPASYETLMYSTSSSLGYQPTNYSLRFGEPASDGRGAGDVEPADMNVSGSVESTPGDKKSAATEHASSFETPLMFSRSSSLGSVSTCSDHVDDQGSVVSEFSRAVSGVISPSELPDSPTHSVPPSPHPAAKTASAFYLDAKTKPPRSCVFEDKSVFEDTVTVFKDENTPIQFSVATSLSSLTFEDEPHLAEELEPVPENRKLEVVESFESTASKSNDAVAGNGDAAVGSYEEKDDSLDVDLSLEEQQAMLAACIDSGKPTSQKSRRGDVMSYSVPGGRCGLREDGASRSMMTVPPLLADSTINYCTEDTPVSISHAASNSDLSLLCPSEDSFLQNSILPLSSCAEDHDVLELPITEEQEKMLNFCIAKGVQSLSYHSNNSFDEGKSSQSSTLSEITEDLPVEDHTLLKDMTESGANLVTNTITTPTSSSADNDYSFLDMVNKEPSEEETNLVNLTIVMGMRSMKESSDLENIGPPSFLAEANLESSLINVEEITDYPPSKTVTKGTPKHRRHEIKDRYHTYTVKQLSPSKGAPPISGVENSQKSAATKPRRIVADSDRFKTRVLSKSDFEEIAKCRENDKSPQSPGQAELDECGDAVSEGESYHEAIKAKIVKPVTRAVKSGIPVVRSKLPPARSPASAKKSPPTELPVNLQRQNTFTKDEPSAIPVRRNSIKGNQKTNTSTENIAQFKSGIPSRIKEPSPKGARVNGSSNCKSPDIVKNRWSISENNLNAASALKATSNTSLNASPTYAVSKVSPSASQSALPIRRESGRSGHLTYKK